MVALQATFTYVPAMNVAFETAPIDLTQWGYILGVGLAIYTLVGLEKWLRGRWRSRHPPGP